MASLSAGAMARRGARLGSAGKVLALLFSLLAGPAAAQVTDVAIPALASPVVDTTGTLDAGTVAALTTQATALQARKGSQLQVLMVPTTGPETIEEYAVRAFEQWKLGRKGVDDGVLLVVAKDDRHVRIEVGYGLEGAIPDAIANRVIQEYLSPRFRAGDYAGGLVDATAALAKLIEGEALPEPLAPATGGAGQGGDSWMFGLFAALFAAMFARRIFGGAPRPVRGVLVAAGAAVVGWLVATSVLSAIGGGLIGLLVGLSSTSGGGRFARTGGFGGFGGGLGGGGGFGGGGGGWSGGGGGSGGGGASGSW